jgi:anti-sigma factor RsiW
MKEYASCEQAREEFSALLDGELEPEDQDGVEQHLYGCADCLRELDGLKKVTDEYGDMPEVAAPDDLEEAILHEIEPPLMSMMTAPRSTQPVSFKPVIVAVLTLSMLAILSYLITQFGSTTDEGTPTPVEDTE